MTGVMEQAGMERTARPPYGWLETAEKAGGGGAPKIISQNKGFRLPLRPETRTVGKYYQKHEHNENLFCFDADRRFVGLQQC